MAKILSPAICPICGKILKNLKAKAGHMSAMHSPSPQFLQNQGRGFTSKQLKEAHQNMSPEKKAIRNKKISFALIGNTNALGVKSSNKGWSRGLTKHTSPILAETAIKLTGRKQTEEHRQHVKHTWFQKGHLVPQQIIDNLVNYKLTPEQESRRLKAVIHASHPKPNKPERQLMDILQHYFPNKWEYVGDGKVIINGLCPDFINIDGEKQIIEFFGDYWHSEEDEQYRIDHFAKFGFKCLIIWEHELENEREVIRRLEAHTKGD